MCEKYPGLATALRPLHFVHQERMKVRVPPPAPTVGTGFCSPPHVHLTPAAEEAATSRRRNRRRWLGCVRVRHLRAVRRRAIGRVCTVHEIGAHSADREQCPAHGQRQGRGCRPHVCRARCAVVACCCVYATTHTRGMCQPASTIATTPGCPNGCARNRCCGCGGGTRYVERTADELQGSTISSALGQLPDLSAKVKANKKPRVQARRRQPRKRDPARPLPGQAASAAAPQPVAAPAPLSAGSSRPGASMPAPATPQAKSTAAAAATASTAASAGRQRQQPRTPDGKKPATANGRGNSHGGRSSGAKKGAKRGGASARGVTGGERALAMGATAMANASAKAILESLPDVLPGEWAVRYRGSTTEAVHIRADGGGCAKWPSGSLAVSVDVSPDPEAGGGAKLYRMFVMSQDSMMVRPSWCWVRPVCAVLACGVGADVAMHGRL